MFHALDSQALDNMSTVHRHPQNGAATSRLPRRNPANMPNLWGTWANYVILNANQPRKPCKSGELDKTWKNYTITYAIGLIDLYS